MKNVAEARITEILIHGDRSVTIDGQAKIRLMGPDPATASFSISRLTDEERAALFAVLDTIEARIVAGNTGTSTPTKENTHAG